MQLALYTFALLFTVQGSDLHRFPGEKYAYDTYLGLGLSEKFAGNNRELLDLWNCKKAWAVLHSAWFCEWKNRYLMELRFLIGKAAYERGEMPVPPVRMAP